MVLEPNVSAIFPSNGSMARHPLPSTGSPTGQDSPASTVLWDAPNPCRPSRRTSLPSFGGTTCVPVHSLLWAARHGASRRPGLIGHPDAPVSGVLMWRRQGLPGSWGTRMHVPCSQTPTGPRRQAVCDALVLPSAFRTASAPAVSVLTGLNHTARAFAVYASQDGLLRHHARLASGCWPDFARRDWLPAGSQRKVSVCLTTSHPPSPGFPWRKRNEPIFDQ